MQVHLENEIKKVFNNYESFVISIKGDWGTGKTFFWNNFKEKKLSDKKYAYVSLFGKESIEDIRRDVILQISAKDKAITSVKDKVSNIKTTFGFKDEDNTFGITGSAIGSLMSLFEKKDFKNVVICFDDFERMSSNLDIKEVLGYFSVLKEQFDCKIVLILNDKKISKDKKVYKDYKEKIVDFEYSFNPSVKESYNAMKKELDDYHSIFFDYCKYLGINNIRVMKRVARLLNMIHELLKKKNYRQRTIETFIHKVLFLSIVNYKFGFNSFEKLETYTTEKQMRRISSEEKFTPIKTYEKILSFMKVFSFFSIDMLDKVIIDYLETSVLDESLLIEELDKLDKNHAFEKLRNEFFNLEKKFIFDLGIVPEEYVKEVYTFMDSNRNNIFRFANFDQYLYYLNQLKELDNHNIPKYDELLKETAHEFIDYLMELDEQEYSRYTGGLHDVHIIERFKDQVPDLIPYISERIAKKQEESYNCKQLVKAIKKIKKNSGWGPKDEEFFNGASKEFYSHCMMVPETFEQIVDFLKSNMRSPSFRQATDSIIEVLNDFEGKNINGNAHKIKRIKFLVGL